MQNRSRSRALIALLQKIVHYMKFLYYPSTNASCLKYHRSVCQCSYLKLYTLVQRLSNIEQFNLRIANIGIQFQYSLHENQ